MRSIDILASMTLLMTLGNMNNGNLNISNKANEVRAVEISIDLFPKRKYATEQR